MSERERGYNEFRVKVRRDHPAIFQGPILCDSCNKWIESEMVNITYYENMDGVIDTQRAICDDCFEKYEYYQELDETTLEQFNEAYHRRPAYPSVYGRFCLNCGYKLDFDRHGMGYRATCQNCNWRNKLGVDYKEPETPSYELITFKRERLKDGFIQLAYPNIKKKYFKRLPRKLQNALMHLFEEPETLRKEEYDLIDSKIIKKTHKEIRSKIRYWKAIDKLFMNLRPDRRFQVMKHQIKHRDENGLYKIQKISEFATTEKMEWKELKKFILNFVKTVDYRVDLNEYFYTRDVRKLSRKEFIDYELFWKERRYFLTDKGEKELKRLMEKE